MSTSAIPAAPEGQKMSAVQRIVNIFIAPSKVFADLNRDPSWWPAWLLISVFALFFMYTVDKKIGFDQVAKNNIAASSKLSEQMEKGTAADKERVLTAQTVGTKFSAYAAPVFILIFSAIFAGLLVATFNFGLGAEVRYGVALGVVFWAGVPRILYSLLGIITMLAGADPEGFNLNNPVATNVGFFFNRLDHPVLHNFLSFLDIFTIWNIVLLGIGFSLVSKVKRGTATVVAAGWFLIADLVLTAIVAAFA
jgi:hypothetical protein